MNLNERDRALDLPDGRPGPVTWHDHRDVQLTQAFAELRRRAMVTQKFKQRGPLWRNWRTWGFTWALVGILAMWLGVSGPQLAMMIFVAVVAVLAGDPLVSWFFAKRLQAHALAIQHLKFGPAVLWEGEPAWELLAAALQTHQITLTDLFRDATLNKKITPVLADALTKAANLRSMLHNVHATRKRPSMHALEGRMNAAGTKIAVIYVSHTAQ